MRYLRLIIHGRVQGVGYRAWLASEARRRGLEGWVRNRREGTVEAVIGGDDATLDAMIGACNEGPLMARVTHIDVIESSVAEIASRLPGERFSVLPTA